MHLATILHINARNGMFVIKHDGHAHSVLELYDSIDIAVGDRIRCEINALGEHEAFHVGEGQTFTVIGQTGETSLNGALRNAGLIV